MPESQRQLAAIMFTDIVGYTALMGKSRDKAMDLLRRNKEIQMPLVEKYNGKWLKEMGDGTMSTFPSASNAIDCALAIQQKAVSYEDLNLRIGIHLGEVVIEENDAFGDGVNITSRLQSIADPGGIYISDSIHSAIRGRDDIQSLYLGEVQFKNVDHPVKTYALQGEGLPLPGKLFQPKQLLTFFDKLKQKNVLRVSIFYLAVAFIVFRIAAFLIPSLSTEILIGLLIAVYILTIILFWNFEFSFLGKSGSGSKKTINNPYSKPHKTPLIGNLALFILFGIAIITFIGTRSNSSVSKENFDYSVAVMYIENLTDNEKFGDQLVHLIHTNLSQDTSLKLVSRQKIYDTMLEITGESRNPDRKSATEVARRVSARTMLFGQVMQEQNEVIAQIELIDVSTGDIISTAKVYGKMVGIFKLADDITSKMSEGSANEKEFDVSQITTVNYEAYQIFYEGVEEIWDFKFNSASQKFKKAIELDSSFALAYVYYVLTKNPFLITNFNDNLSEPLEYIQTAIDLSVKLPERDKLYIMAINGLYRGDMHSSLVYTNKLLELDPDSRMAHALLSNLNYLIQIKSYESRMESFLRRNPDYGMSWNSYAYYKINTGQIEEATNLIRKYIELEPNNYNPLNSAWEINMAAGKKDRAFGYLDSLETLFTESIWPIFYKGHHYLLTGQPDKSLNIYQSLEDSTSSSALQLLGPNSYLLKGQFHHSGLVIDRIINKYGNQNKLEIDKGIILLAAKEYQMAYEAFGNIVDLSENLPSIQHNIQIFLSFYYQGIAGIQAGHYDMTRSRLDQLNKMINDKKVDWRLLDHTKLLEGELLLAENKLKELELILSNMYNVTKWHSPHYMSLLYRLEWKKGEYQKALDILTPFYKNTLRAMDYFGGSTTFYCWELAFSEYHIGQIYEDAQNPKEAIKHYQYFLDNFSESDPGIPEKEDARRRIDKLKSL